MNKERQHIHFRVISAVGLLVLLKNVRSVSCAKSSISATKPHALLQNEWLPHYLMALNCSQRRQRIFRVRQVTTVQAMIQHEEKNTVCINSSWKMCLWVSCTILKISLTKHTTKNALSSMLVSTVKD